MPITPDQIDVSREFDANSYGSTIRAELRIARWSAGDAGSINGGELLKARIMWEIYGDVWRAVAELKDELQRTMPDPLKAASLHAAIARLEQTVSPQQGGYNRLPTNGESLLAPGVVKTTIDRNPDGTVSVTETRVDQP